MTDHGQQTTLTTDLFVTVDGYAKGDGAPPFFGLHGPDLGHWIEAEMAASQQILMGRVTYQALDEAARENPEAGGDWMGQLSKVVFSKTLSTTSWDNCRVSNDAVSEVIALKAAGGPPLRTFGSVTIVSTLIAAGLVDRVRLVIFPQLLARTGAEPAFAPLSLDADLDLLRTTVLDDRLIVAEYHPHPRSQ